MFAFCTKTDRVAAIIAIDRQIAKRSIIPIDCVTH